jgi:putative phosphoribosyl transferase
LDIRASFFEIIFFPNRYSLCRGRGGICSEAEVVCGIAECQRNLFDCSKKCVVMFVRIPIENSKFLDANIYFPHSIRGVVIFHNASAYGRFEVRHALVAHHLLDAGFVSCVCDLLYPEEEGFPEAKYDIAALSHRLIRITQWIQGQEYAQNVPCSYLARGTSAAAAVIACVSGPSINSCVSLSGRIDIVADLLSRLEVPTRLIVAGNEEFIVELNRHVYLNLAVIKELDIIPSATHLFYERPMLDRVMNLAIEWFNRHGSA